jgi:DNA-binding CsgD family transcriptional regulator
VAIANAALQALDRGRPAVLGAADRELAAGLAERAEQPERAGALFAEIGVDALAAGALASAAVVLNRATQLLPPGGARTATALALVTALADAGRVDEALTATKELLVDEVGESRAIAHLRVARAAMAATRWDLARAQLAFGRQHVGDAPRVALRAEMAVLDGELAFGVGDISGALQSALVALETVEVADAPDVACEALLLRGRAARASSLEAAQAAFAEAASIAEAHDLRVWQLRSLHELGTIDMLECADARLLEQARALADELGALATATVLDIELCANYVIAGDDERSIAHGRAAAERAMDLRQIGTAIAALHLLGTTYVVSGDRDAAHAVAAVARGLSPDDHMVEASFLLAVDALAALLDEDRGGATTAFEHGMTTLRNGPVSAPASHKGLWPLLLAVDRRDEEASEAIAYLVDSGATVNRLNLGYLDYARAILAGRRSHEEATNLVARGDGHLVHGPFWHQLGRRLVAEAATSDGWGDPERWWSEAGAYFDEHGHEAIAVACAAHGRTTGTVAERARSWRFASLGVTRREADVLELLREGLANKEIAGRLVLSPRTVEKHVESLLRKMSARSRTHLASLAGQIESGAL